MRIPGDQWDFNPRSPHGERRQQSYEYEKTIFISIHAPRTGSDVFIPLFERSYFVISIHAPRTGSDCLCYERPAITDWISIHAPRTGSDIAFGAVTISYCHFNPRSPHGERPRAFCAKGRGGAFQSTLPARGATSKPPKTSGGFEISIHAPRTGSDGRPRWRTSR